MSDKIYIVFDDDSEEEAFRDMLRYHNSPPKASKAKEGKT